MDEGREAAFKPASFLLFLRYDFHSTAKAQTIGKGKHIMTKTTRRGVLGMAGLATGSMLLGSLKVAGQAAAAKAPGSKITQYPWPYVKLDPKKCAERAYKNFLTGHCMYGSFEGIVGEYAEIQGAPYTDFPWHMLYVGAGGGDGWASLCGSLNGAMLALALFNDKHEPLVDELFNWYQAEPLPDFRPEKPRVDLKVKSSAGSILCHVSLTKWCKAAGVKSYSLERDERCGWLTASVAYKAVEILNAQLAGTFKPAYPIPAAVKECRGCHEKGGILENTRAKMACTQCHFSLGTKHP